MTHYRNADAPFLWHISRWPLCDSSLMQILMKYKWDGRKRNLFISVFFNSSLKNRFLFKNIKIKCFFSQHSCHSAIRDVCAFLSLHQCRHQLYLNVKCSKCDLSVRYFSKSKWQRPVSYGLITLHKTFCIYWLANVFIPWKLKGKVFVFSFPCF